jgi:cysteine synthase A
MQGWTPDFIPKLTADALGTGVVDRILTIKAAEAMRYSKELAQKEGIFVGSANILCMLPDTGERYLSTPLFANVPADMTEEELEISRSTPSAQFNA